MQPFSPYISSGIGYELCVSYRRMPSVRPRPREKEHKDIVKAILARNVEVAVDRLTIDRRSRVLT
jgi:DNA-binding GntR family transcriptional regulator